MKMKKSRVRTWKYSLVVVEMWVLLLKMHAEIENACS